MGRLFNESTFALAVTMELLTWVEDQGDLVGVPLVPTLRDEARVGYDLALPTKWAILFLQFKVSQRLTGLNAKQAGDVGVPYYRFAVKTDRTSKGNVQHNELLKLQQKNADALVYYVAPFFHTVDDLYRHLRTGKIWENSVFADPGHLPSVKAGDKHCYTFTGNHDIRAHSVPTEPTEGSWETLTGGVRRTLEASESRTPKELMANLAGPVRDIVGDRFEVALPDEVPQADEERFGSLLGNASWLEREIYGWPKRAPRKSVRQQAPTVLTPFQAVAHLASQTWMVPIMIGRH